MFNITEQPWTLLAAAAVSIIILSWLRYELTGRRRLLWLLPFLVAGAAFGLDYLVQTDVEQIKAVVAETVRAAEREDCAAIEALIADDYGDSFHKSKKMLMTYCRAALSEPTILKAIHRFPSVAVHSPQATVVFAVRVLFDPQSYIYEYRKEMLFRVEATLRRQDGKWLFVCIEIPQVDGLDAGWNHLQDR